MARRLPHAVIGTRVVVPPTNLVLTADAISSAVATNTVPVDVLANDTPTNGIKITGIRVTAPLPAANLSITGAEPAQQISVNLAGLIAGTTYTADYDVALISDPTVTGSAKLTITITGTTGPASIDARDQTFTAVAASGMVDVPVLADDVATGPMKIASVTAVAPLTQAALSIVGSAVRVNTAGLTAGATYTFSYRAELADGTIGINPNNPVVTPITNPYPPSQMWSLLTFPNAITQIIPTADQHHTSPFADGSICDVGCDRTSPAAEYSTLQVLRLSGTFPSSIAVGNRAKFGLGPDARPGQPNYIDNLKCHAIVSLPNNVVVLYYYRLGASNGRNFSTCMVSTDDGVTFEAVPAETSHLFSLGTSSGIDNFQPRGIIQPGPGYGSGPAELDRNYFYVAGNNLSQGGTNIADPGSPVVLGRNGGLIYLCRYKYAGTGGSLTGANLRSRSRYSFFTGLDVDGNPTWGADGGLRAAVGAVPIFRNVLGGGSGSGIGTGYFWQCHWHEALKQWIAVWIPQGSTNGVSIAHAPSLFNNSWQMLCNNATITNVPAAQAAGWYLSASAPAAWSDGTRIGLGASTYIADLPSGVTDRGDDLILTQSSLLARIPLYDTATVTLNVTGGGGAVVANNDTQAMAGNSTAGFNIEVLDNDTPTGQLRIASVTSDAAKLPQANLSIVGTAPNQAVRVDRTGLQDDVYSFTYRAELMTDSTQFDTATCTCTVGTGVPPVTGLCTNPATGKIRNLASTSRLIMLNSGQTTFAYASFYNATTGIRDQITKVTLNTVNESLPPGGTYDHRDSGIQAHAQKLFDSYLQHKGSNINSAAFWVDWEQNLNNTNTATNVPASVNYTDSDRYHASFFEATVPPSHSTWNTTNAHALECRTEAVRYGIALSKALNEIAAAAGTTGFEHLFYAIPDQADSNLSFSGQAAMINASWMCPYTAGVMPPCYFSDTAANLANNLDNPERWTNAFAATIRDMRAAFGADFKIFPALWAKFFVSGGSNVAPYTDFPNDDPCVPATFLAKAFKAVMDNGANGITVFQNSDMTSSRGALADRYSARHQELVDAVKADGRFVGLRYP